MLLVLLYSQGVASHSCMRPLRGLLHDPKIQVILRLVVFRMGLLSRLVTKKAFLEGTVGTIRGIEWFLRAFASMRALRAVRAVINFLMRAASTS